MATSEIAGVAFALASSDNASASSGGSSSIGKPAQVGVGLAFAALYVASAVYGYRATDACAALGEVDVNAPADPGDHVSKRFDLSAARVAIAAALGRAAQVCNARGPLRGQGAATLTYGPDGYVTNVVIAPPFADEALNACVIEALRAANARAFDGDPIAVRKRFDFGKEVELPDASWRDAGESDASTPWPDAATQAEE